jgi:uncharacterized membrane protein
VLKNIEQALLIINLIIQRFWTKLSSASSSVLNSPHSMTLPRITYTVILSCTLAWCVTILLAPYLASSSSPVAGLVYRAFHPICHQLPERSFHVFGEKLAVCSRCSAIYFAFLIGVFAYPFIHRPKNAAQQYATPSRIVLLIALLPMVIDVGLDFLSIHESGFVTRTITGALFGIVIPFFVVPAAIEGVEQIAASKRIPISTTTIHEQ